DRVREAFQGRDRDKAARLVTDEMVDTMTIIGEPEACRKQMQAFFDAGVQERALSRIETMDRTGYDCVWLAEHHFNTYSVCPSINVMATHVAARTQRLRIGMAVSLAAFYNPLRLAEEVAMIDVLSGGRVNWGAGR